jgi:hypothetical protein
MRLVAFPSGDRGWLGPGEMEYMNLERGGTRGALMPENCAK